MFVLLASSPFEITTQLKVLKESFHAQIVRMLRELSIGAGKTLLVETYATKNCFRHLNEKVHNGSHVVGNIHAKSS